MFDLSSLRKILFSSIFILLVILGIGNQVKPVYSLDQAVVLLERQKQGRIKAYFKLLMASLSQLSNEYQEQT